MAKMKEPTSFNQMQVKLKDLRYKVRALQKGINELKSTGIRESEIYQMVLRSANRFYDSPRKYQKPLSVVMVKAIISGVEHLEDFVYPDKKLNP
ncbi:MAG: hypothetical protein WC441_04745 [Patescibacteria group bacterium]